MQCLLPGRRHRARASGPCPFLPWQAAVTRAMGPDGHIAGETDGWNRAPRSTGPAPPRGPCSAAARAPATASRAPRIFWSSSPRAGPRGAGGRESRRGRSNRLSGRPAWWVGHGPPRPVPVPVTCHCRPLSVVLRTAARFATHSGGLAPAAARRAFLGCLGKGNLAKAKGKGKGMERVCTC